MTYRGKYPKRCLNPRCREERKEYEWALCPACRAAGAWGMGVMALFGAMFKLLAGL